MKVTKRYNQYRRDLWIDLECENCNSTETYESAYDDRNFWDNVVPSFECESCGKSTEDLGLSVQKMQTRYPEGHQV
jgi:hypothetical protein